MRAVLSLLCIVLHLSLTSAHADTVIAGSVLQAAGVVSRIDNGNKSPLQRGDDVYVGNTLQTQQGSLTLRMRDNAIVTLKQGSSLTIQAYQPATPQAPAAIKMELKEGVIRTKTGAIGSQAPHRYRLNTPFAALGIRGTDYSLQLRNQRVDLFVHEGTVNLSPFSSDGLCTAMTFGPCSSPLATDLKADSGSWLRLEAGSTVERIQGVPEFIRLQAGSEASYNQGIFHADGTALEPIASLSRLLQSESDETNNLLPEPPSEPTDPEEPTDPPNVTDGYWTEYSPVPLSEAEIREHFRRTAMSIDAYQPSANLRIFNVNLTLGKEEKRYLASWFDTSHQRIWGKQASLETLLAARYWPEGLVWNALPGALTDLKGENIDWLQSVRNDTAELWKMPLDEHSIVFTPQQQQPLTGTHSFETSWVQPLTQGSTPQDFTVGQFKADKGRFSMVVSSGDNSYTLRGAVGDSGMLLASSDQFELRGHQDGATLLLMITDKTLNEQWMLGLNANGQVDTSLGAQWQNRHTGDISWGHWADFARLDQEIVTRLMSDSNALLRNRHFAIYRPQQVSLPESGSVGFQLSGGQAIYSSASGYRPAAVSDGQMNVNFDQQTFDSSFNVTAPGLDQYQISGQGQLTSEGLLQGDSTSDTLLQGTMGPDGDSASLLFEHHIENGYFSGITHWK